MLVHEWCMKPRGYCVCILSFWSIDGGMGGGGAWVHEGGWHLVQRRALHLLLFVFCLSHFVFSILAFRSIEGAVVGGGAWVHEGPRGGWMALGAASCLTLAGVASCPKFYQPTQPTCARIT